VSQISGNPLACKRPPPARQEKKGHRSASKRRDPSRVSSVLSLSAFVCFLLGAGAILEEGLWNSVWTAGLDGLWVWDDDASAEGGGEVGLCGWVDTADVCGQIPS
jgi:hypothetical protein